MSRKQMLGNVRLNQRLIALVDNSELPREFTWNVLYSKWVLLFWINRTKSLSHSHVSTYSHTWPNMCKGWLHTLWSCYTKKLVPIFWVNHLMCYITKFVVLMGEFLPFNVQFIYYMIEMLQTNVPILYNLQSSHVYKQKF